MSANPNNTPEQKAAWAAIRGKKLGSTFVRRVTPTAKAPSRRDLWRAVVADRKNGTLRVRGAA